LNTGFGAFDGKLDDFWVVGEALTSAQITALMNRTLKLDASATTLPLPSTPGIPVGLLASGVSRTRIDVSWQDVEGETGYELYRSNGTNGNYLLFATLPANTVSYSDSGLFANTINYYKVRAINAGGASGYSNEDSARTTNSSPVITSIGAQYMRFGTVLEVNVVSTDEDGESLTVLLSNAPGFASYTSTGNGSGTIRFSNPSGTGFYGGITVTVTDPQGGSSMVVFDLTVNDNYVPVLSGLGNVTVNEQQTTSFTISATDENTEDVLSWSFTGLPSFASSVVNGNSVTVSLSPGYADNGPYEITVRADDGRSGVATGTFTILVNDVNPNKKTYINFTDGTFTSPSPWNNTNKPTPSLNDNFANLLDETGANSGIGLQITSPWQNLGNAVNTFGVNTGNNSGVYPDNVIRTCYFTTTVAQTIRIYGLNPLYKYNFTFFGSRGNVNDNRTTVYSIGGTSVSLNGANNSQNTVSINHQQPGVDGTLVLTLQAGSGSSFGYLNAMVIESLYDDGSVPARARNLRGTALSNSVRLDWVDAAYNEASYQVYRSTSRTGGYTLQNAPGSPANSTSYTDASVIGGTTYYYYVVGVNGVGSSLPSDTATVTLANVSPLLSSISDVQMRSGQTVLVDVTAADTPGDVVTLTVSGLPSFATFTTTGNGTGRITLSPVNVTGTFTGITVTATDNRGASSSVQFNIAVAEQGITTYRVNFNQVLPVGSPWNSFNSVPSAGATITGLRDEVGVSSGISVTLVDGWDGANDVGASTGNNSGVYPDDVMRTAYFTAATTAKRIRITGLTVSAAAKYNLIFFASRGGVGDNRNTTYSYNGQSVTLNAASNTANTVQLQGVVPNAGGVIEFTATRSSGSSFGYINALVIQSYEDDGLPLAPTNLSVSPRTASSIELRWTDRSNNETGFEVYRSLSPNSGYSLLHTTGANATSYVDGGLSSGTIYYYRVRAKAAGEVYSGYSNVAGSSTLQYSVFVNFNQTDPAASPWNNTNEGPIEGDSYALKNDLGNPTGINMRVEGSAFNGVNPFGMNTGNNSGVVPDNVMRSTWWLDANTTAMLRIEGLNITSQYNFVFFASRDGGGSSPDRTTVYTVNGKSASLNAVNNTSTTATVTNVVPDANGSVLIEIRAGGFSPYAYIGGMIIQSFQPGQSSTGGGGVNVRRATPVTTLPAGSGSPASVEQQRTTVSEVSASWKAQVYPNPFTTSAPVLELTLGKAMERVVVTVVDLSGRQVLRQELRSVPAGRSQQRLQIEPNQLGAGIYLVRIEGSEGNGVKTLRLVKAN
jgi:fibronectin type 3 domain-containing protein